MLGACVPDGTVCAAGCAGRGLEPQPSKAANRPRLQRVQPTRRRALGYPAPMWILLLEALGALALLAFIVWWTMFSGRRRGEWQPKDGPEDPPPKA